MRPEKELRADHQAIRRAASVLDGITGALREGHAIPDTDLRRLVDQTRELMTRHQGGKRQATLELLVEHPDGPDHGTIRKLDERYDEILELLTSVDEVLDAATQGDTRARDKIHKRAGRFVEAVEELLGDEETAYLTALDSTLSREELDDLGDRFEELEEDAEPRQGLEAYADKLADRYERYLEG